MPSLHLGEGIDRLPEMNRKIEEGTIRWRARVHASDHACSRSTDSGAQPDDQLRIRVAGFMHGGELLVQQHEVARPKLGRAACLFDGRTTIELNQNRKPRMSSGCVAEAIGSTAHAHELDVTE